MNKIGHYFHNLVMNQYWMGLTSSKEPFKKLRHIFAGLNKEGILDVRCFGRETG